VDPTTMVFLLLLCFAAAREHGHDTDPFSFTPKLDTTVPGRHSLVSTFTFTKGGLFEINVTFPEPSSRGIRFVLAKKVSGIMIPMKKVCKEPWMMAPLSKVWLDDSPTLAGQSVIVVVAPGRRDFRYNTTIQYEGHYDLYYFDCVASPRSAEVLNLNLQLRQYNTNSAGGPVLGPISLLPTATARAYPHAASVTAAAPPSLAEFVLEGIGQNVPEHLWNTLQCPLSVGTAQTCRFISSASELPGFDRRYLQRAVAEERTAHLQFSLDGVSIPVPLYFSSNTSTSSADSETLYLNNHFHFVVEYTSANSAPSSSSSSVLPGRRGKRFYVTGIKAIPISFRSQLTASAQEEMECEMDISEDTAVTTNIISNGERYTITGPAKEVNPQPLKLNPDHPSPYAFAFSCSSEWVLKEGAEWKGSQREAVVLNDDNHDHALPASTLHPRHSPSVADLVFPADHSSSTSSSSSSTSSTPPSPPLRSSSSSQGSWVVLPDISTVLASLEPKAPAAASTYPRLGTQALFASQTPAVEVVSCVHFPVALISNPAAACPAPAGHSASSVAIGNVYLRLYQPSIFPSAKLQQQLYFSMLPQSASLQSLTYQDMLSAGGAALRGGQDIQDPRQVAEIDVYFAETSQVLFDFERNATICFRVSSGWIGVDNTINPPALHLQCVYPASQGLLEGVDSTVLVTFLAVMGVLLFLTGCCIGAKWMNARRQMKAGHVTYSSLAQMVGVSTQSRAVVNSSVGRVILDTPADEEEVKEVVQRMRAHLDGLEDAVMVKVFGQYKYMLTPMNLGSQCFHLLLFSCVVP